MKTPLQSLIILTLTLMVSACGGARVFINDTRLRGPVPDPAELAAQATAAANATATAEAPKSESETQIDAIVADLTGKIGKDLAATNTFSGRETPRAAPLRGMRIRPGDTVRIASGRSQETAAVADEYCVDQGRRCSSVWVYGRPGGKPQGAWFPIVIFEYGLE